jgi:hypothetical protein
MRIEVDFVDFREMNSRNKISSRFSMKKERNLPQNGISGRFSMKKEKNLPQN